MLIKVLLQFVGCVFVSSLTYACWLRQLLSIVCLDASRGSKVNQDWRYVTGKDSCDVRLTAATTFFDLLCFVCVLLQQRIVESSYFKHCILQFFIESQLQQRGKVIVNARMEYHLKMQRDELDRAQAEAKKKLEDYSNEMKASYTPISYGHTKRAGECLVRQRRHRSNDLNIESDVSQNSNTEETTADKDIPKNDVENEQTEKFQQPSKSTGDSFLNEVNANSAFILEGTTNIIYMVNDELYRWCRDYRFISHFVKQESKPLRCLLLEKTQYMAELEVIEGWRQEAAKCLREVPLSDVNRNEHWHLKEQIKSVQTTLEYTRKEMKNNIANDENYSKKEEELTKTKSELDEQKKTNKEAKDNLKKKEKEIYLLDKEDPKKKKGEIELDEEIRDLNEKIKIWIKNNDAYFGKLNDLKKEKGFLQKRH
uniref:Piezo domain-containing protein n=1 Tax=Plectus sambesii TaxID=2011161 RepID=A0A914WKE6_9BILA